MRNVSVLCKYGTLGFLLTVVSWTTPGLSKGYGQDFSGEPETLREAMSSGSSTQAGIQDRLDALIKSTQNARMDRQADFGESNVGDDASKGGATSAYANRRLGSAAVEAPSPIQPVENPSRSLSEIRERLRILQRLRRDPVVVQQVPEPANDGFGVGHSLKTSAEDAKRSEVQDAASGSVGDQSKASLAAIDANLMAPESIDDQPLAAAQATFQPAEMILPKPVNAMALGESLYRTENFESALTAFQSVDVNGLSQSDRTWLDLLIALCQRKLGDHDKTQGILRDIANEESSDYPVKAAKWWLKHAESTYAARTRMDAAAADLDLLIERSRQNVTQ